MPKKNFIFTSESVTEGHPDKMADRISDAILDALLAQDPASRVAVETLLTTGLIVVAGEVTTKAIVDYRSVVRDTVRDIGFTSSDMGFDADTCGVMIALGTQSPDISVGVDVGDGLFKEQGAGDQGLMFGYATDETKELMPLPITLAHSLTQRLTQGRKEGALPFARPDGKSQVSVCYEQGVPKFVDTVVVSTQHDPGIAHADLKKAVIDEVIRKTVPAELMTNETRFLVNPTGKFVVGGPMGDAGLTGRKIIVDTYGGWGRHGGGAFSGKDPSKVDRSATYFARYVAKNVVAAGLARRCEVQIAYAIGVAEPVSVLVDTQGTGAVSDERIEAAVREVFDFRPRVIIEQLNLLRPIYKDTSAYGHFGRALPNFTWERTDRVDALRDLVNAAA